MEHTALFEERVALTPRDLRKEITDIDSLLLEKLSVRLENKCSSHGFVVQDTLKLLSRSMGYIEKGRFTGDVVFHLQAEGKVLNPPAGTVLSAVVVRKNKMGMYVSYQDAINIILPRDLHIGNEEFEAIEIGQTVEVEIQKSRFQVNDPYILSVGLFRSLVSGVPVVAVEEEEEELIKEEVAPVAAAEEEEAVTDAVAAEEEVVPAPAEEEEEEVAPAAVAPAAVAPAAVTAPANPNVIEFYSKKPEFKELSNFYAAPFSLDGKTWPSVEHYFQAMKFPTDPAYQETIRQIKTPQSAKSLGSSKEHPIRPDWDSVREEVMKKALEAKFTQNEALKQILLSTKGKELVEASPTDIYWGIGKARKGQNRLGKLLMELRDTINA